MLDMNKPDDIKKFGEKIRSARKKSENYNTLEKLAEEIGVKRSSISDWEKGKKFPSINHLTTLCNTLNIDLGYLLDIYDEDNAYIHSVSDITGLSAEASVKLIALSKNSNSLNSLEALLSHEKINILLDELYKYTHSHNKYMIIDDYKSELYPDEENIDSEYNDNASIIYYNHVSQLFGSIIQDIYDIKEKYMRRNKAIDALDRLSYIIKDGNSTSSEDIIEEIIQTENNNIIMNNIIDILDEENERILQPFPDELQDVLKKRAKELSSLPEEQRTRILLGLIEFTKQFKKY